MAAPTNEHFLESSILWIGKYPSRWSLTRVKYEAYVKARVGWHGLKSDDFTEEGPYLVTGSDFKGPRIRWEECYHCDLNRYAQDPYIQLSNGDLLITKDGTIGKVALVEGLASGDKATLNSGVFVVRPLRDNFLTKFYFWLLQSRVFTDFVDYNKTGSTIVHLYQDTFINFTYASPDINEQVQIAAFLDYEIARIDQLIAKQQRLIELLKEKRQAVISHAVTKGLNPNALMKDSGVEWLGQVPEHWGVVKLSYVLLLKSGDGITSNEIEPEGTYPVYGGNGLRGYCEKFNCNGTYALIGRQGALCGNINVANGKFFASEHAVVVYPRVQFDVRFLSELLRFMDLGQYSVSAAQPGISVERINMLSIAVPPMEEQALIGQRILQVEQQIGRLVMKAEAGVLLLKERRTALISAAVTGKIDVRDWTPPKEG
ncbi:restriction endonuclease subunit S [Shewanella decolorationis]|uniref:Restriction endonuclease subunit S n=1 Tax=Shewanella decolorationis TaxID=256839 RepID=A0A5B8QWY0_9GAMM|nr:restriction endonuclease subunit S [Shewanella decolorationis]QDZ91180.1 restriction endonuclease subunit S [Shewanella decolorationis]